MKRLPFAAAVLLCIARPAHAADTVTISTPAPFDRWCIKPLCADATAAPPALVVPPFSADSTIVGYAEERLRAAVAAEINTWIEKNAADWNTKPIRDLARSSIAAVLHKDDELAAAQGVGASLLRVGLTLRLESALPIDKGCDGPARRDAIYEGLAITRALGVLSFPEAKHEVLAACQPTAMRTADAVDGMILRALDPGAELSKLVDSAKALHADVRATIDACASVAPGDPADGSKIVAAVRKAKSAPTLGAFVEVARAAIADKDAIQTWTDGASATCGGAIGKLTGYKIEILQPFDSSIAKTLLAVDVQSFVTRMSVPNPLACTEDACVAARTLIELARKGINEQTMRQLVVELRARLGLTLSDSSVFKGVVDALDASVTGVSVATIDGKAFVTKLLAKYCIDEDGQFSVTCAIAGKPEPLVLEANAGVPRLASDDLRFVGDLTLGWKTKALGIVGRGALAYYDYTTATGATDNTRAHGSLEAWYRSGDDSSKVRLELRMTGGIDYYDATFVPNGPAATTGYFHDEDSLIGRGTLLAGLAVQPSAKFLLNLLVGGGAQYESYGYLATDPKDPNVLSDTTAISGRGNGRILVRWSFWPSILSFRVRAEASFFRLTRDVFTVAQIGRPMAAGVTSTEVTQIETTSRAFLDLDVAKLLGFVPAVWGGVDYIQISSEAGNTSISVPVVGIGIVRPAF